MSLADAVRRAEANSPFLRGLLKREAELVARMEAEGFDVALAASMERLQQAPAMAGIRRARAGVALTVALADIGGAWPLERVTRALSDFADAALQCAIQAAFAERGHEPAGMVALALGKLGSHELNYSSDIDPIFIHDPEGLPRRAGEDPTEAAVRLVRRIVALLAERTADGYALRVDLRLRPDPDSTPSSMPIGAAELYYQSQALAWERMAFVRARACAGDVQMGETFLRNILPFVWRRSLDYSAIADIRDVSHRIRDHYAEGQAFGPGFDLKRGRGGIREIEFFAQIHQLIFGGREERLRAPATLDALPALAAAGRISADDAQALAAAYRHLRTLEHRVQMLNDAQTHLIPKTAAERNAVAGLLGLERWAEVQAATLPHVRAVSKRFDRLVAEEDGSRKPRLPHEADALERWARASRIADPNLVLSLLANWRSGRPRSLRAPESQRTFEVLLPTLLSAVARGREGREGLLRLDRMIQALPSGVQFWTLLQAQPALVGLLGRLLTATPLLADALAKRPDLIDTLLSAAEPLLTTEEARAELALATAGLDGELLLDRVRRWHAERRFLLGARLLEANIDPLDAADTLSNMADAAVLRLAEAAEARFAARHGRFPAERLVLLALGRWGGRALTAQSDLDLVISFTGDFQALSNGPAPLSATAWFNRFAQRLINDLTVPTAAGPLFEVDTRLRPSGSDGLLAVSLDSFARYQREDAETWEQMALTRARPLSLDPDAGAQARMLIDTLNARARKSERIRGDAVEMRRTIAKHKPPAGPWDLKLIRGGMVDIEFIIQTKALLSGRPVPPELAAAARLLAPELVGPYELMMRLLVLLRLVQPADVGAAPSAATGTLLARSLGLPSFAKVAAEVKAARAVVQSSWEATFIGEAK